jgi:hypothetical protein
MVKDRYSNYNKNMRKCCHSEECRVDRRSRSGDGVEVNGYTIEPGANLSGADLRETNLSGANLREVDLRGADLQGANLEGARSAFGWDNETRWPDGFDPEAAGVSEIFHPCQPIRARIYPRRIQGSIETIWRSRRGPAPQYPPESLKDLWSVRRALHQYKQWREWRERVREKDREALARHENRKANRKPPE